MKIREVSDLHLEWDPHWLPSNIANDDGIDVLILSGDIMVADYFQRGEESPYYITAQIFRNFIKYCSENYPHVIYVMGNHEHYQGRFNDTQTILEEEFSKHENFHLLERQVLHVDGVDFIGGCLWTDLNRNDPNTAYTLSRGMNDYRVVQYRQGDIYRKLIPSDTRQIHDETLRFFRQVIGASEKCVVCTHHAPSTMSIGDKFKHDYHMNGGYASDLSEFILDHPQIKVWFHGHMHDSSGYFIGETRIIANPKGYRDENENFNPKMIVEI